MRTTGTVILGAYILACLAAMVFGPLIILHGYRAWWLDLFYATAVCAFIGGSIGHYRAARRNKKF